MLLLIPIEISQTASSGAWAFNTDRITGADLRHIYIKAATDTTTFNVTITDEKDNIIYATEGVTGTLRHNDHIPMRGIYTIAVDTSSADEAYTGRIMLEA